MAKHKPPHWAQTALQYVGQQEYPGKRHNKHVLRWWELIGTSIRDDETPWCGAFVGGILKESGLSIIKGGASARAWQKQGSVLTEPAVGALVIFWRGSVRGWSGHVGIIVGKDQHGNLMVLGGNQGNAVSIKPYKPMGVPGSRVLGYRWPTGKQPYKHRYNLPVINSDGKYLRNEA